MMSIDAVQTVAGVLEREWGSTRVILSVTPGPAYGSALAEVGAGDGSRWFIGSTRWGNHVHADTREECSRLLAARAEAERD
jgi:hypothetical protein